MRSDLRRAVVWLAYRAGVNLNYVFDPVWTWRHRRQPLFRRGR